MDGRAQDCFSTLLQSLLVCCPDTRERLAKCICAPKLGCCLQRAMGEFGAVSVISGNIIGKTQTLTLYVESAYKEYNTEAAFSAAVLLSFLALITLVIKEIVERASSAE